MNYLHSITCIGTILICSVTWDDAEDSKATEDNARDEQFRSQEAGANQAQQLIHEFVFKFVR